MRALTRWVCDKLVFRQRLLLRTVIYMLVMVFSGPSLCQENSSPYYMEGRALDKETKEPVAFATILNRTTGNGTVSNLDGYFRVMIRDETDSIVVSMVGYKRQQLVPAAGKSFYEVFLEQHVYQLQSVKIVADDSYLYRLMEDCRKKRQPANFTAKTYYELRSFSGGMQVELLECLYNANISGYDITELEIKAGRFALQKSDNGLFISLESSKAIVMHKLFRSDNYFPRSPLELSWKKMKKEYRLRLIHKYVQDNDSVYVVECQPRDTTGIFFKTTVWVDPMKKNILRVDYECSNAGYHPFLPLERTDSILNVDMHISKKFTEENGNMSFSHIDFFYDVEYKNPRKNYKVSTRAVLFIHDREKGFDLPHFDFSGPGISDYRKINAIPYNPSLWSDHEMKMNYRAHENNLFFEDKQSLTSSMLFAPAGNLRQNLLKYPYVRWSSKRIGFGKYLVDSTTNSPRDGIFISSFYNLSVKIFLDINFVDDSLQVTTVTILDPYESYYRLPVDNKVLCFINIYFDLVELERRSLEAEIKRSAGDVGSINRLYERSKKQIEFMRTTYFNEVQRGNNTVKMSNWNKKVVEQLGIDNMRMFGLLQEE